MKIVKSFKLDPVAASRPRVSRHGTYYGKAYTEFREDFKELTEAVIANPLDGALSMTLMLTIRLPKSWTKKKKIDHIGQYHTQTPDTDNFAKAIMDGLNGIYYHDDSQIAVLTVVKRWGNSGSIYVKIEELNTKEKIHEDQSTIYDIEGIEK